MKLPLLGLLAVLSLTPLPAAGKRVQAEALYQVLDAASADYREGLAQLQRGEREAGRERVREAAARLLTAANRCRDVRGCDTARFIAAYDALIGSSASLLDGSGEGYSSGEAGMPASGEGGSVADSLPEAARMAALINGRDLRELIVINEPVRAALSEWLTWMRPQLIASWENYQRMRFLMWPEYERAGLPEALLFGVLAKESNGRVHAVSRAGAAGPLQFMPATGQRFGLGWQDGFDTRYDPQLAARASTLYFNERFAELNNSLEYAIAAYNGGEGRALRLYRSSGGRDFWDPQVFGQLPPETRDYVPYVLAAALLFLHPEDYGLQFPPVRGAATVMKLEAPASLYQLAICLGGERDGYFRTLRNLNPRHEPHVPLTPGSELRVPVEVPPVYRQHCLQGPRAELALNLVQARKPVVAGAVASASGRSYKVRSGDTLSAIARRHQCRSADQLARVNNLRAPYILRPGQQLRLQGCSG